MCHELMYSKRSAAKEARQSEQQEAKETPPQRKVERTEKIPEPA